MNMKELTEVLQHVALALTQYVSTMEKPAEEAPAPKRRGRPPKTEAKSNGSDDDIWPEAKLLDKEEEKPAPKKRGRPRKKVEPKVEVVEEVEADFLDSEEDFNEEEPEVTLEMIRKGLLAVQKKHNKATAMGLLADRGVTQLSKLPEKQYATLYSRIQENL